MFRLLTIFALVIGFVAEAWADLPPPPPPPGQKYVQVVNQVRLGKEFDDWNPRCRPIQDRLDLASIRSLKTKIGEQYDHRRAA